MSSRAVTGAEAAVGFSDRTLAASSLDSDRGRIDRVIVLQGSRSTEKECVEAEKDRERERTEGRENVLRDVFIIQFPEFWGEKAVRFTVLVCPGLGTDMYVPPAPGPFVLAPYC